MDPLAFELAFLAATQRQVEHQQDVQGIQPCLIVGRGKRAPEQVAQQFEITRLGGGIFGVGGPDPFFVDISRDRLVVRKRPLVSSTAVAPEVM